MELRAALAPRLPRELHVGVGRLLCCSSSVPQRGWRCDAALLLPSTAMGQSRQGHLRGSRASQGWVRRSFDARQKGMVFVYC